MPFRILYVLALFSLAAFVELFYFPPSCSGGEFLAYAPIKKIVQYKKEILLLPYKEKVRKTAKKMGYKVSPSVVDAFAKIVATNKKGWLYFAMAIHESSLRPKAVNGRHLGLLQVSTVHLKRQEVERLRKASKNSLVDECSVVEQESLFDPETNICAAMYLYKKYHDKHKTDKKALIAYNGGSERFAEKVLSTYEKIKAIID
jgi:soluble lytic murein transglycosylase-like protein